MVQDAVTPADHSTLQTERFLTKDAEDAKIYSLNLGITLFFLYKHFQHFKHVLPLEISHLCLFA